MSDRTHLLTSLRRAGNLELERHRRSGRSCSLVLLRLRPARRAPGARGARRRRLRARCRQHLRPFDAVDVSPAADLVGIVTHDTDEAATARVTDRLIAGLGLAGYEVVTVGSATFPSDGLLWSHLETRALERLIAYEPTIGNDAPDTDTTASTVGDHR